MRKEPTKQGSAAEGVALKIRRTPAGGAGRDWDQSPFSAESEDSGRPPHCRRPLRIRAKNASFSCLNSSMSFLHAKFAKSAKIDSPLDARIRQNRTKSPSRKQHKKHMQKVSKHNAKPEAHYLPKQAFRLKRLHFLSFAASAKKYSK